MYLFLLALCHKINWIGLNWIGSIKLPTPEQHVFKNIKYMKYKCYGLNIKCDLKIALI